MIVVRYFLLAIVCVCVCRPRLTSSGAQELSSVSAAFALRDLLPGSWKLPSPNQLHRINDTGLFQRRLKTELLKRAYCRSMDDTVKCALLILVLYCCIVFYGYMIYTVFRKKHPLTFSFISPWKMFRFIQNFQGMFLRN